MTIRTIGFLPEIFRSSTNQKFLNATLDQLVSEPSFKKINGYIGRKFAPTFKTGDNYLPESTAQRQSYQLEPCVVSDDANKNIKFFSSYADLLQQIEHFGGFANNHSRLFSNEAYSFDGLFDFDKLVNFSQYYWLPNGPDPVDVFSGQVDTTNVYNITRNLDINAYTVGGFGTAANPDLTLARGGVYQFVVNQPGFKFWIQTDPGISGTRMHQSNINTREVYGVEDNGSDNGIVIFNVPQLDAQDEFVNMPLVRMVDVATTIQFSDIDHKLVKSVVDKFGGIDGVKEFTGGEYIVFLTNDTSDPYWDEKGVYGLDSWGSDGTPLDDGTPTILHPFDEGLEIPVLNRYGSIWQLQLQDTGNGNQLIHLLWIQDIPANNKVFVMSGTENANKEFYKDPTLNTLTKVPLITAPLDILYYNDGSNQQFFGRIRLVNTSNYKIDINNEILGKKQYTSPNGVVFTNGLKVRFGVEVLPAEYVDTEYYVEGVGIGIRLEKVKDLITPELKADGSSIQFDVYGFSDDFFDESLNGPITPDYITINRASVDGNAWSRSNRWFHSDVLSQTSKYNNKNLAFDHLQRAKRPIIEFNFDLQLFNYGRVARHNVDVLDFTITDAATQVEGSAGNYFTDTKFVDGMTVIFVNDYDPTIRNKIFKVNVLDINSEIKVHLTEVAGGGILNNDTVIPTSGATVNLAPIANASLTFNPSSRKVLSDDFKDVAIDGVLSANVGLVIGHSFWYNGSTWVHSQQKLTQNIPPLFDIIDHNNISLADTSYYQNSSFAGCKIFSYKEGTGNPDPNLGFPLSYRNFNNVGDIEFQNNFDLDTFTELVNLIPISRNVNSGFVPGIVDKDTLSRLNIWATKTEDTKQYQIISNISNGATQYFEIDILPATVDVSPNIKVFVNNKLLAPTSYAIVPVGIKYALQILTPTLVINDKVDILIYSTQVSNLGFYEIPSNFDHNSLNKNFLSLTLGQFRNHLTTISENSSSVVGQVPGASNVRDLDVKSCGGSILQHSAPALYSSLFLLNKELSFINAITLAQQEYSKFKNRFLESFSSVVDAGITDPVAGVDYIMQMLNAAKSNLTPWYYSDMIPYDQNKTITEYTIIDAELKEYEIATIFNDTVLSNQAILVYVNGKQLLKGTDYSFNQTRPSIVFANTFQYDDLLQIHTYHNTDGCYIPETPTKLGLYPKFAPITYVASTYQTPIPVIRGHDGSITPNFGDLRDDLLLEFEKRIYNNIKVSYSPKDFDIFNVIPGQFRNTDYSKAEYDSIVSRGFLSWVGNNRVDFSTNEWFASNNPWSWNYKHFRSSVDNKYLPGYWRGIYQYYYDTDAPNERPWEMLGFGERPSWWVETYGPAPYTGGNLVMWGDLELGLIRYGDRTGIHSQYARPGLSKIIPVTNSGELRSPDKFLITGFNSADASGAFSIGDQGPVETAWRRSSDYPFAVQQALALMKPGQYFSLLANVQDYSTSNGVNQFIIMDTKQRITPADFKINGDTTSNGITRNAGYLNWIADYITSYGASPATKIRDYLDGLEVQLGYKVAGYTDKSYLKVLAEQSSPSSTNESIIIPDDNYRVHLHKSSSVDRVAYSAVIVEKTTAGYSISGYNTISPFFTIIPSDPNANQYQISASGTTGTVYNNYQRAKVTIPYGYEFKNKQQVVDFLVSYERYLVMQGFSFEDFSRELQDTKNFKLSIKEFLTWTQQGWAPGNVLVLSPIGNTISLRYANAVVDVIDNLPTGSKILDLGFNVVKNSLFNVVRDEVAFTMTTLPEITIGLLDLNLVQYEHVLVFDNETLFNDIIYKPELGNRQYRLKLIGNKTSGWTGQVNPAGFIFSNSEVNEWSPGQDYRKGEIVSSKSFIYSALGNVDASDTFNFGLWQQLDKSALKTGLLPNLAYNAKKFENMYDVDNLIQDQNINTYSNGLIGYRERNYLSDLSVNDTSQAKFYQGYIRDKGTKDAVTALTSATFNNLRGDVTFNEEWAFRVGEYGALESNQFVEIQLSDGIYTHNPIAMSLLNPGEVSPDAEIVGVYKDTLYKKPQTYKKNIFGNRTPNSHYEDDIQTAGYVNLNDIDTTIFDIQNYQALDGIVEKVYSGYKIWVAKDVNRDWNVYRTDETSIRVVNIAYELDGFATMTMSEQHGLVANDLFIVKGFSPDVDSFYKVTRADDLYTVFVSIVPALEAKLKLNPTVDSNGAMYRMHSLRKDTLSDTSIYTPANGWLTSDKVWIDTATADGKWAVYKKNEPWSFSGEVTITTGEATTGSGLGSSMAINANGLIGIVGAPTDGNGKVKVFVKMPTGEFTETVSLSIAHPAISDFGRSVDVAQNSIVVGAPGNSSIPGKVAIYTIQSSGEVKLAHILDAAAASVNGDEYGRSISLSRDGKWLYVGAPGVNKVYVYAYEVEPDHNQIIDTNGTSYLYPLNFTPHSTLSVAVTTVLLALLPEEDYVVHNGPGFTSLHIPTGIPLVPNIYGTYNYIEFKTAPTVDTYQVIQSSYYDTICTLESGESVAYDRFGHSVKTQSDGTTLVVGAPKRDVGPVVNAGTVYLFNRYVQEFIGDGVTPTFVLGQTVNPMFLPSVYIDGIAVTPATFTGTTLSFATAPLVNQKIRAELNVFSGGEEQKLIPAVPVPYETEFGSALTISDSGKDIFVGATGYGREGYYGGVTYRFTNEGQEFNSILTKVLLIDFGGQTIRINNKRIVLPIGTESAILHALNVTYAIPGLKASNENGHLRLVYTAITAANQLTLLSDSSSLSLDPYIELQIIEHPFANQPEKFGSQICINETSGVLAIASEGALTANEISIDKRTTTFDGSITVILDVEQNTGSVYLFEALSSPTKSVADPVKFGFIQSLASEGIDPGDNFGASIAMSSHTIAIGSNHGTSRSVVDSGKLHYFSNPTFTKGWEKIREQNEKVNIGNITRMYLYDRKSQTIIANLDHIDPSKGKILGQADQDIAYKTSFDPANYNVGTNASVAINADFHWGAAQVGQVWWNLDKVRYIDYEQSDLTYRTKNWGRLFPGAMIEIVEWVESNTLPSGYIGDGIPLYSDDSAYVQDAFIDTSGVIRSKYYFWVKDKTTVSNILPFRNSSTTLLTELVSSPNTQDIPYVTVLQDNSVALVSANSFISANDTILHIDYSLLQDTNVIHNEYELVQENSDAAIIPTKIVNKFIDSITGTDSFGNVVPDFTLSAAERYGISIRPRQTMFIDRLIAIKNFTQYSNNIFKQYPIVEQCDLSKLYLAESTPQNWDPKGKNVSVNNLTELSYLNTDTLIVSQRILVLSDSSYSNQWAVYEVLEDKTYHIVQTQSYDTADYWSKVNWFDLTYDPTVKPTYTVSTEKDIAKITLASGDTIWVKNNGANRFVVYRINSDLTMSLVGVEAGTIQLSDALWAHDTNQIGFGNDSFDTVKFDLNPTIELRNIITAIKDDIFVDELDGQFNKLFFVILNYVLSEQRMIDWAFKTSFVSIIHKLRKLEQFPNYIRDNQSFYEDYINEVKPYRTQIREYLISYDGADSSDLHPTDFDLPSYYDADFATWRSPNGEHARDELLLSTQNQYADWNANHTYVIESVQVTNKGYGYSAAPTLTVVGGGGTGAVLEAVVDFYLGSIIKINVLKSGSGYTSTPTIQIAGDGVDTSGNQTATCYPMLANSTVRAFDSILKFDRITYTSKVKQWAANTAFNIGDIVSYKNHAFTVNAYAFKVWTASTLYKMSEIVDYDGIKYKVKVEFTSGTIFNDSTEPYSTYNATHYSLVTSGPYFDPADYTRVDDASLESAADRVIALYNPAADQPAKDLPRLFGGTEFPGNHVDGNGFIIDPLAPFDTLVESHFADLTLGQKPEDIGIVGGNFIDVYNSHAPEEFLPGMIFDTLDIQVFTVSLNPDYSYNPSVPPLGYRISKVMSSEFRTTFDNNTMTFDINSTIIYDVTNPNAWEFRRICAASTVTLVRDLNIADTSIYVDDVSKLPEPGPGVPHPGVVYVNGEKITYYKRDVATNSLTQLRRGAWGTGTPEKHATGALLVDASVEQLLPSTLPAPIAAHAILWQPNFAYIKGDIVTILGKYYQVKQDMTSEIGISKINYNNYVLITAASTFWIAFNSHQADSLAANGVLDLSPAYKDYIYDASGIYGSNDTEQTTFIKGCSSYLPWLPGESGNHIDPNAYHTRFDDDGLDQFGTPIHPYDQDPFDSYIVG